MGSEGWIQEELEEELPPLAVWNKLYGILKEIIAIVIINNF